MVLQVDFDPSRLVFNDETNSIPLGTIFRDLKEGLLCVRYERGSVALRQDKAEFHVLPRATFLYEGVVLRPDYEAAKLVNSASDEICSGCIFIPYENREAPQLLFALDRRLMQLDLSTFAESELSLIGAFGVLISSWKLVFPTADGNEKVLLEYSAPEASEAS